MGNSLDTNKILVATDGEAVVSNSSISLEYISPCKKEEADTRIFCHVKDLSRNYQKVKKITVDSDVVIIALGVYHQMKQTSYAVHY